jgi:hypothetical protein
LKSFSKQEKALFLQFVTGTSKVMSDVMMVDDVVMMMMVDDVLSDG